jgi:hypothetical protein
MAFGTPDRAKFVALDNHLIQGAVDIFLFNFAVDDDRLRPQHIKFLDDFFDDSGPAEANVIVFQGTRFSWRATIVGEASRTGSATHNLDLSTRRGESVRKYLLSPLPSKTGGKGFPTKIRDLEIVMDPKGSTLAAGATREADRDRQVVLRLQERKMPPLPPIGSRSAIRSIDPGLPSPPLFKALR